MPLTMPEPKDLNKESENAGDESYFEDLYRKITSKESRKAADSLFTASAEELRRHVKS